MYADTYKFPSREPSIKSTDVIMRTPLHVNALQANSEAIIEDEAFEAESVTVWQAPGMTKR